MLVLYTWRTPNGLKPLIMLEELGLSYDLVPVDIGQREQWTPSFLAISPSGKIPALVDSGIRVFESGAILVHLAMKHGQFLPYAPQHRASALAWSFWQVGGLGPAIGQWAHFKMSQQDCAYSLQRFHAEATRLLGVLEQRLAQAPFLAGSEYSIADMMIFPWARDGLALMRSRSDRPMPELPLVDEWVKRIGNRAAVRDAVTRLDSASDEAEEKMRPGRVA